MHVKLIFRERGFVDLQKTLCLEVNPPSVIEESFLSFVRSVHALARASTRPCARTRLYVALCRFVCYQRVGEAHRADVVSDRDLWDHYLSARPAAAAGGRWCRGASFDQPDGSTASPTPLPSPVPPPPPPPVVRRTARRCRPRSSSQGHGRCNPPQP